MLRRQFGYIIQHHPVTVCLYALVFIGIMAATILSTVPCNGAGFC